MDYQTQYYEYKALADAALNTYFTDTSVSYHRLLEAMHYSLAAGGKRLRPVLVLAFCAACGGDVRAALPVRDYRQDMLRCIREKSRMEPKCILPAQITALYTVLLWQPIPEWV